MADTAPLVDTSAAKLQPLQREPEAETSPAAPATNVLPDLDRTLHAAMARLTGGLAPSALAGAYLDWMTHLAVAPGRQMQLAGQAAMGFFENLAFASRCAVGAEQDPSQGALSQDTRFRAPNGETIRSTPMPMRSCRPSAGGRPRRPTFAV